MINGVSTIELEMLELDMLSKRGITAFYMDRTIECIAAAPFYLGVDTNAVSPYVHIREIAAGGKYSTSFSYLVCCTSVSI